MLNYWNQPNTPYFQQCSQYPIFFISYPYQEFGYQNSGLNLSSLQNQILGNPENSIRALEEENRSPASSTINRDIMKRSEVERRKKSKKDEDYGQRKQKADRNAPSSAIKLFIKYMKMERPLFIHYFERIREKYELKTSYKKFFAEVDRKFNFKQKYFSPYEFMNYCKGEGKSADKKQFGTVMRILLDRFWNNDCHLRLSHKFNSNKKLFSIHVKAGQQLVDQLQILGSQEYE